MKIPFHRTYMDDAEISAVTSVMKSGWITMGEKTFEFERNFSSYVGVSDSVAVNSCTAALHLALKAAGIKPGDEVIIPAMTFIATWEVITYLGATPVLADVDRDSFLIDPASVERKISSETKAIIPVHYGGEPCDMDDIASLVSGTNIKIIEDAAHALPSKYKGRMIGTIGDATCFSFYATKTITTGEGGMITTSHDEWSDRIRRLRLHGITKDAWNRYSENGSWEYDVSEPGYKYNITDIAAAIGIGQLKKCDLMNGMRRDIARRYNRAFESNELIETWRVRDDDGCAWHLYPLRIRPETLRIGRDEFIRHLNSAGVGTSVHYIPMYRFSCMKGAGYRNDDFPGCEDIFRREVSLPVYPGMTVEETGYVIDAVTSILENNRR